MCYGVSYHEYNVRVRDGIATRAYEMAAMQQHQRDAERRNAEFRRDMEAFQRAMAAQANAQANSRSPYS